MPKFQALYNTKDLTVPFIEKDKDGKIVRDQSIVFNRGLNSAKGFVPAYFHTGDKETIDYLRAYPGNIANGGHSFEEVLETESPKAKPTEAPKDTAPVAELDTANEESKEQRLIVYESVTTVNEASQILLDKFEELVTRDVNTRAKIASVAASKGISFPNL